MCALKKNPRVLLMNLQAFLGPQLSVHKLNILKVIWEKKQQQYMSLIIVTFHKKNMQILTVQIHEVSPFLSAQGKKPLHTFPRFT